jgi:RNA polymerase sigma-70 factor, ECF subfamily
MSNSKEFSLIYETYHQDVFRLLYFMSGNKEVSEDLLQNSFIKAFKNFQQLKQRDKFKSWIFQIARNQYLDYLKSADVSKKIDGVEVELSQNAQAETVIELNQILNNLSPEHREVLILTEMEGMTAAEVSEITGLSESAVKSRLLRARKEIISKKNESI